ncbi:MAG: LptF/LptG family permease, partial [Planctomycetes bacterium]|nr:LptF/LptG family permease [Planctomycetota bacterium]
MARSLCFVSVGSTGPLCESVMGFPWTLQRYIFREMGRTFLLTAITLTCVLGLGGGVMNMIKLGDVTTGQLFRLMCLVVPIAAALTLPIAALFSAGATYGRL